MKILALDPGCSRSALVALDERVVVGAWLEDNGSIRERLLQADVGVPRTSMLVVEQVEGMGMAVGAEVFETVWWSGRFMECWRGPSTRLTRRAIKLHLCGHTRANDTNIRMAMLDRYGPGRAAAVGTTKQRGPLYGLKADLWQALAVGVTYLETAAMADRMRRA